MNEIYDLPKDLVPAGEVGEIIATKVNADNTLGDYETGFSLLNLSTAYSETSTTENLTTGRGADIPFITAQSETLAITMNADVPPFYAMVTGKDITVGSGVGKVKKTLQATGATGEVGYTFADAASAPVAKANGTYEINIMDSNGLVLKNVSSSTEAVATGQFKYDADTMKLSFADDMSNKYVEVMFDKTMAKVAEITTKDILDIPVLQLETWTIMQSASTRKKYVKYEKLARGSLSGDVTRPTAQKGINSSSTYNFASQDPPLGEKRYTCKYYEYEA